MSTPPTPSPSMYKFDILKNEILEQRKCLKRVMEKLDRDEEMVEKSRMEIERAQQRYECSVRELEKTASKVKAVLEPMKVNKTDPPLPFSIKGKKKVLKVKEEKSKASPISDDKIRDAINGILKEVDHNKATFSDILKLLAQRFSADLIPRKPVVKVMILEELTKLVDADETDKEEDVDDAIAKKQKKKGSSTQAQLSAELTPRKSAVKDKEEDEGDAIAKKQKKKGSSTQGEEEVGEYSGPKAAGGTQNSGVDQHKKRTARGTYMLCRRCDLKIIDYIKMNLERESLEGFKASCFGRLLETKELESQGQLLLHLLLNVDKDASNREKKLIFKINNSNIEFGPREFCRITGLRVGTWDGTITPSSSSSSIHKKIFKGSLRILLKDVKEAFLCHKGKGELSLKLALLYFLYGTLLARNNKKMIDLRYVYLIEDLHKFNEFPWGQVAYEFLVSSSLSTRAIMDNSSELKKPIFLTIYGFSVALQVWAYEWIPALAEHCAVRLNISENLTPRILHWSRQKKVINFDDLRKFFTPGDEAHLEDIRIDANQQVEKGKLLSHKNTAEVDTIIISDTDDDDDRIFSQANKRIRRDLGETRNTTADSDARSMDSDVESCSSAHMDELVAACASKSNLHK